MKTLKWSLLVVLVTGVGVLTMMRQTRSPRPLATDASDPNQAAERTDAVVYQSAPSATVAVRKLAPAVPPTPDKTDVPVAEIAAEPSNVMRVRADQVPAQVNDKIIQLKDLAPLEAQEAEKMMTAEEYASRLNRAIEMELTFHAATAQGVDLSAEQKKRLDSMAQKHEATLQEYGRRGVTWSSVTPAQVELEKRLTSALMLQQNLVAREADVKPSPDAATQARYEDALRELIVRLKSSAKIGT